MNCEHCSITFEQVRNGMKRFCNEACKYAYRRTHNICVMCHKLNETNKALCGKCAIKGAKRHKEYRKIPKVVEKYETYNKTYRQKKRDFRDALKKVPCMDCGNIFPPYCMDFHHRDPKAKRAEMAKLVRYNNTALLEEAAKCDLVCSNCHRIRTWRILYECRPTQQ